MSHAHGQIYLFTLFGTRALSLEAMRPVHNRVAGAPEDVAAAKSLSDLSHMVYTSVDEQSEAFVIMDLWTDLSGFNQFFSEPARAERQAASLLPLRPGCSNTRLANGSSGREASRLIEVKR